ncbi:hypothetical protein GYMLUDRAFT_49543 [Collybiopsis luxurians FD-317 M1]|uniref:Nephrocystin 3-like N-terminal domain-containing protein n=1 Tax=Collybiopsis luxurians FD-317 M1 TaxID=944289 RepID=A0A0D0AS24_9AGAR|nr:hypothetical protein GYMLUDRAFT_49543 [Collybiopsis luxurians FD-317 M1]
MFSNAQEFTINGGSFVAGNLYNIRNWHGKDEDQDSPGKGIEILYQNAVVGAAYNAELRCPPPNCHPGTRTRILEILRNWVSHDTKTTPVYWLYGAAGVGKSAVAQTISEEYALSRLAASFFFARLDPTRNSLKQFFTTISLQLATSPILGTFFRDSIDLTIRKNRNIIHANLEQQFEELILRPCSQMDAELWKALPQLIVIDGLDECVDIASQERLLSIIYKATSSSRLPFEFLICSRPEPRIRKAFDHQGFHTMVARCDLGDAFEPGKDIAKYLHEEFNKIREDHWHTMEHVSKDWPGKGTVQLLVQRACGQFIYAATVLKYVGDYHSLPTEQLEIILNITVPEDCDSPYPDLDWLYLQILSPYRQKDLLLDVLAHLLRPGPNIFLTKQYEQTSAQCIEGLFYLTKGKVGALLFGLHSVLDIPDDKNSNITIRHASFNDFLSDKKRSGDYYVQKSQEARHEQIAFYLLKRIASSIKVDQNFEFTNSKFDINTYAWDWWHVHCQWVQKMPSNRLLSALKDFDITSFLNAAVKRSNVTLMACTSYVKKCLDALKTIANWAADTSQYQGLDHSLALNALAQQYSQFEQGFQVKIEPTLDRDNLMMVISVFKYDLCLFQPNTWGVFSTLLDNRLSSGEVETLAHSPWPCLPISPLAQIDSGIDQSKSGLRSNAVAIKFAECNKHIALQCLQILQEQSQSARGVVAYAKLCWISHLVKYPHLSSEQTDIFQALMLNLSAIQTSEDARKAILWVKDSGYASQVRALHKRLQELESMEEEEEEEKQITMNHVADPGKPSISLISPEPKGISRIRIRQNAWAGNAGVQNSPRT